MVMTRLYLCSVSLVVVSGIAYAQPKVQGTSTPSAENPSDDKVGVANESETEAESAVRDDEDVIIITGTRTPTRRSESPIPTEVITRQALTRLGVNHVGDVLSLIGGVQVTRSYSGVGATLQGLDEKHTLVLMDGERILGQKDGVTDLSRINLDQVERIELVRGAASALYGADALGGVVNIITRKTPKRLQAGTQVGYGTDDAREATVRVGGGIGKFRSSLSAGLYVLPSFDLTPNDGNLTTHGSQMNDWHIDTKTEWRSAHQFKLTVGGRYENRSRQGIEESDTGRVFDREQRGDFYDGNVKITYRSETGVRTSAAFRASYLRDQFLLDQRGSDLKDTYENSELMLYQSSLQTDLPLPKNNLLSLGIDGIAESIESPRVRRNENCDPLTTSQECQTAARQRGAIFAQDSFTPTVDPYLTIVVGTRAEFDSSYGFVNVPRVAVRFDPVSEIKLRASIGQGYRAPTFKELYLRFDNPSVGYTVRGNAELEPERSLSYQVSADWQVIPMLSVNIAGFRNEVDNLINFEQLASSTATNSLDRYQLTNISSAYTQGIQTEASFGIAGFTELRGGYQWLKAWDNEMNRPLMNRPTHQAHGSVQVSERLSGLSLTTSFVWTGTRKFYSEEVTDEENSQINTFQAESFTNLSTHLRWAVSQNIGVFVRGENVLNAGEPVYASQRPRRFVFGMKIGNRK